MYDPLKRLAERLENDKEHGNTFTDNEREAFNAGCEALHGEDVLKRYTLFGLGGYRDTLNGIISTHMNTYKCNGGSIEIKVPYPDIRVNNEERDVILTMVIKIDEALDNNEI